MIRQWNIPLVVPLTHPSLAGHFPGCPIVPGVVLLDMICAVIQAVSPSLRIEAINQAKFLRSLTPGDELELSISLDEEPASRALRARFTAVQDGDRVLEGSFTLTAHEAANSSSSA